MKRYALIALTALAMLPACTAINPERRTLTQWNWELVTDWNQKVEGPKDSNDWDTPADSVIDWVFVQPIQVLMLPISWAGDTFVLNPIEGWRIAEYETHMKREARYADADNAEAAVKNYQYLPLLPPPIISDLLDMPAFLMRWIWHSTYWSDPVDAEKFEEYWQKHYEQS